MNRPIFWYLYIKRTSAQIGRTLSIGISSNNMGQHLYGGWSRISHFSVFKYVLTVCVTWGRALSYWRITLSCLFSYCGRFYFHARFKCINWSRYRFPVIVSLGWSSSQYSLLISSNTEHKFGAMDIRFCRRSWCMAGLTPWLFSLCRSVFTFHHQ